MPGQWRWCSRVYRGGAGAGWGRGARDPSHLVDLRGLRGGGQRDVDVHVLHEEEKRQSTGMMSKKERKQQQQRTYAEA